MALAGVTLGIATAPAEPLSPDLKAPERALAVHARGAEQAHAPEPSPIPRLVEIASVIDRAVPLGEVGAWAHAATDPETEAWVLDQLNNEDPAVRLAAIDAAAVLRTQAAARALVAMLAEHPAEAPSIERALARLTGMAGVDWATWIETHAELDDAPWYRLLAAQFAANAAAHTRAQSAALQRAIDLSRRLYVELPEARRPAFRAGLVRETIPELRRLGLELAQRELAEARPLDAETLEAVTQALAAEDPASRRAAAEVLDRSGTSAFADHVLVALAVENEPQTAAALLNCAARNPRTEAFRLALRWVVPGGGAPTSAAARVLLAGQDTGSMTDSDLAEIAGHLDEAFSAVLTLGSSPADGPGPDLWRLAGALGSPETRSRAEARLLDLEPERARALAEGLSRHAGDSANHLDALLRAARVRDGLASAAVEALVRAGDPRAAVREFVSLRYTTEAQHVAAAGRVGAMCSDEDAVIGLNALRTAPAAVREAFLAAPFGTRLPDLVTDATAGRLIGLATLRFEAGRFEQAEQTLRWPPEKARGVDPARAGEALALRMAALAMSGRPGQAAALPGAAGVLDRAAALVPEEDVAKALRIEVESLDAEAIQPESARVAPRPGPPS